MALRGFSSFETMFRHQMVKKKPGNLLKKNNINISNDL